MPSTITDRLNGLTTSVAVKAPCRAATTANITLSGEQTIDGVAVVSGDRVLVKNQTSAIDNGIYVASTSAWTRATDFDGSRDCVGGTQISVISGTTNSKTYWRVSGTDTSIAIGTDSLSFEPGGLSDAAAINYTLEDALSQTLGDVLNQVVRLRNYHLGDGTAADTALAAAITRAQAIGATRIATGKGHFILTNKTLPAGFTLEGEGDSSRFTVGANNSNVLLLANDNCILRGLKFEGDGTSSASTNGNGIYLTGAGLRTEDVNYASFGHGAIRGVATSAKRGPKVYRSEVRDQGSAGHDFYLSGGWQDTVFEDLDCVNTGSADQAIGMFEETGAYWDQVTVTRGRFEDYAKWGLALSDETWDGSDRVFGLTIDKGFYKNCGMAGIKAKLSKGIHIDGARVEGCGNTIEGADEGLYGAILLNSIGVMQVDNTRLRGNFHGGIKFSGSTDGPPKSYPQGYGQATIMATANFVDGVTTPNHADLGNGIAAVGLFKSIHMSDNDVRDVARYAFYLDGTQKNGIKSAKMSGNFAGHSAATHYAYRFSYIETLQIDGDEGFDYGGTIASFENCYTVRVGSSVRYHDGRSAAAVCIVVDCVKFYFDGSANCSLYTAASSLRSAAVVKGQKCNNGGNTYECTKAGTTAASGGPTGTDPEAVVVDGTAEWVYVHKYRANTVGLAFSTPGGVTLEAGGTGATADFGYVSSSATSGAPSNFRRSHIASGTVTLSSGTSTAPAFSPNEQDASYKVHLTGNTAEIFTWASKAVGGFTVNSNNASSTAIVDWKAFR